MTTEEKLRQRFRAFAFANFGCEVLNPANMRQRYEHALHHDGPHSWERNQPASAESNAADEKREQFGTWAKVNCVWCVRAGAKHNPGDVIRVRSMNGQLRTVCLGDPVAPGVFDWCRIEDEQDGRA